MQCGRVAREEEPVHREGRPPVGVAGKHSGTAQGQAAEAGAVRLHDARRIAGQQPQATGELRGDERVRHLARGLGHAVAGIDARLGLQSETDRVRVQGAAPQQQAVVLGQHARAAVQHILEHFVHHRDVGGVQLRGVAEHRARVEALVESQRPAAAHAAHEHLEAPHVEEGQHRLP